MSSMEIIWGIKKFKLLRGLKFRQNNYFSFTMFFPFKRELKYIRFQQEKKKLIVKNLIHQIDLIFFFKNSFLNIITRS